MKQKIHLLVLLFLCVWGSAFSQNIQLIMSPKPSPYISDWQQQTETVKLVITNSTGGAIAVKIRAELFDGSGSSIAVTDLPKMPELEVSPGVTTYDASEIFPLQAVTYKGKSQTKIMQTGRIPEDNYQMCVALTSPQTGQVIGTSGTVCKSFSITAYQAPTLINPVNDIEILETETKGIVFRWTPIIPKPKDPVTYRLQVWEVLDGQTPMIALRSNQPIVEKDLKEILQTQWPIDNPLPEAGKKYVWAITPLDADERKLVDGNGFAEPFVFSILSNSPQTTSIMLISPANGAKLTQEEAQNIAFRWTPIYPKPRDLVVYKLKIVEVKNDQSEGIAIRMNKPIVEKLLNDATEYKITERITFPPNCIWQIDALDANGKAIATSGIGSFMVSSAGCGTNDAKLKIECDKIINGIQTYKVAVDFYNVAAGGVQTCNTSMNTITSTTGVLTNISSLPATIPANGNVTVTFIYTPNISSATTADFAFQGIWNDGNSNTSNFSKPNNDLPKCPSNNCCPGKWTKFVDESTGKSISHLTNLGTFKCDEKRKFTFCYDCPKGCGESKIKYEIIDATGNVVTALSIDASNCATTTITFPNVSGTYELRVSGLCNGKVCNWLRYPFTVECKQTGDCCPGKWTKSVDESTGKSISHLTNLGTFKCDEIRKFTFCYDCPKGCGKAEIRYEILNNTGVVSTQTVSNCVTTAVTFPNVSGTYELRVSGICGGKVCNWLRYPFTVKCDSNANCCKGGYWKQNPNIYNKNGVKVNTVTCPQNGLSIMISPAPAHQNCDEIYTVKDGIYACSSQNCVGIIYYELKNNVSNAVAAFGTNSVVIPNTLPNGTYTMVIKAICGKDTCETCSFAVTKNCQPTNCCTNGSWAENVINGINYQCGGTLPDQVSGSNLTARFKYNCNPNITPGCQAKIVYMVKNNVGVNMGGIISNPSGVNTVIPVPTTPRNYCLWAYAYCNGVNTPCDSCKICFKVIPKDSSNCCTNGTWGKKLVNGNSIACNTNIVNQLLGSTAVFNYTYNCNPANPNACPARIRYIVRNAAGNTVSGPIVGGSGINTNIVLPSSGSYYCVVAYAYCGTLNKPCDSCTVCFKTVSCCTNSGWGKKFVDAAPIQCNANINTLFANTTHAANFNYSCNPNLPNLCNASIKYYVKKSTGAIVSGPIVGGSGANVNFSTPAAAGYYCLWAYAYCGTNPLPCDSCKVCFKVENNCCTNGTWGPRKLNNLNVNCNTSLSGVYNVGTTIVANYSYNCNPLDPNSCKAKNKFVIINTATGVAVTTPVWGNSGTNTNVVLPSIAGEYCLVDSVYCGNSPTPCAVCKVCFKVVCNSCDKTSINIIANPATFNLSGSINTGTRTVSKVMVTLVSMSANSIGSIPANTPKPNFEFKSSSTIGGAVAVPFSLSGTRSNIVISNTSFPVGLIAFSLDINETANKTMQKYLLKFTITYADGTTCEMYKSN